MKTNRDLAFRVWASAIERPLSAPPAGESDCARRVRLLEDAMCRMQLFDKAGLKVPIDGGRSSMQWAVGWYIEAELTEARRALRFERGNY